MHRRLEAHQSDDEDDETYNNDVVPESPSSCEDSKISKPSSKKRKSSIEKKRVVSLPIADVERSKSRVEVYPPSDSWTWRKYGQKPIKGSPYPRGYYKCSSSKGCPARKQVERNRVDPTNLVVTYAGEHNHPLPSASASATAGSHKFHQNRSNIVLKATKKENVNDEDEVKEPVGLDLSHVDSPLLLGSCYSAPEELGWFYDVAFSTGADVAMEKVFSAGEEEEEESLFGDLDDLPDCAAMFRRGTVAGGDRNRRCDFGAVSLCDSSR